MQRESIDINCDLGEGMAHDAVILPFISSVNIACGFHAGDETTMRSLVRLAKKNKVAIGAHPSYNDRENFGRNPLQVPVADIYLLVQQQLELLAKICSEENASLHHIKPHGALYNQAATDHSIAQAIANAVKDFDAALVVYGLSGGSLIAAASAAGLRTADEVFADRGYQSDGQLIPRTLPGALITDPALAAEHALALYADRNAAGGLKADTVCFHGDNETAPEIAVRIRRVFTDNHIQVKPPA